MKHGESWVRVGTRVATCGAWCALAMVAFGCAPVIGDACERHTEGGAGLMCDAATPGGYCTISPCRVGDCPEEAVCIDFQSEQTFCMRRCDQNQGCREGLTCREDIGEIAFCGVAP